MKDILNVVNEDDEIIGQRTREDIHKEGLLHREITVCFVTPDNKVIFQHRAKNKETYPDLLDSTVGGHVEIGDNYIDTAIKETKEKTGLSLQKEDFIFMRRGRGKSEDEVTGKINNVIREVYIYIFKGNPDDLVRIL